MGKILSLFGGLFIGAGVASGVIIVGFMFVKWAFS